MARPSRWSNEVWHVLRPFRSPLVTAPPLGAVLGAAAGLLLWLNEFESGGGPSLAYLVGVGGALGIGLAVIATLGAAAALLTGSRTADGASEEALLLRIAAGAAVAPAVSLLAAGIGSSIAADSWQWFGITCWVAIVTAVISGVSATATTAIFRYRPRRR